MLNRPAVFVPLLSITTLSGQPLLPMACAKNSAATASAARFPSQGAPKALRKGGRVETHSGTAPGRVMRASVRQLSVPSSWGHRCFAAADHRAVFGAGQPKPCAGMEKCQTKPPGIFVLTGFKAARDLSVSHLVLHRRRLKLQKRPKIARVDHGLAILHRDYYGVSLLCVPSSRSYCNEGAASLLWGNLLIIFGLRLRI